MVAELAVFHYPVRKPTGATRIRLIWGQDLGYD